jgi:hypothetical protein
LGNFRLVEIKIDLNVGGRQPALLSGGINLSTSFLCGRLENKAPLEASAARWCGVYCRRWRINY